MKHYLISLAGSITVLLVFLAVLHIAGIQRTFGLGIGMGIVIGNIQRDIERWLKP